MSLLKEKLLAKSKRKYGKVVDSDGDEWTIRSLSEKEKSEQDLLTINRKNGKIAWEKTAEAKLRFIAKCLIDPETNEPIIPESEWQSLEGIRSEITSEIYSKALKMNGYEDDEVAERLGESS